jgi:hypothetical protein
MTVDQECRHSSHGQIVGAGSGSSHATYAGPSALAELEVAAVLKRVGRRAELAVCLRDSEPSAAGARHAPA